RNLNRAALLLSLVSAAILLFCYLLPSLPFIPIVCSVVVQGLTMGCLMQLWSLRFAMTGVGESITVVCSSAFLSVAFFLIMMTLPPRVVGILHFVMLAFSATCSLMIKDEGFTEVLTERTSTKRQWWGFWLVRALYGSGIGFLVGLIDSQHSISQISPLAAGIGGIVGFALLLGMAVVYLLQRSIPIKTYALPALPFLAVFSLLLVSIDSPTDILGNIATSTAFLCFMILTSVQICNYRMQFGMRATSIAFGEKLVVCAGWLPFAIAGTAAGDFLVSVHLPIGAMAVIFACILVIGAVLSLSRYSLMLNTLNYYEDSNRSLRRMIEERCHELAVVHKLTPREEEIICMMAKGRSSTYIINELVISEGTFRTHSYRIYQKLGIHKNIELLNLILGER
ncbi:MAG: helix-turn-helix transcriptional regulator, partial [Coriobacteriales bacterium]|nr:helix-turn-helix transcriptional regulator [Coriobacteriales bacterium]